MIKPATAPWDLSISASDFEKLKAGFTPRDMNDRWEITTSVADSDPDHNSGSNSKIFVYFARSWTGEKHYILSLLPPSDTDGSGRAKVEAITWEQEKGTDHISEEQGKKEAVLVSREMLGCEFEELPFYDIEIFWNHPGVNSKQNAPA